MNIFVPNFVDTNDYTPAAEMGELIFMTKGVNIHPPAVLHKKFATYFADAQEEDVLLLSGSNIVCATAYAEWCKRFPTSRNLLTFDRRVGYTLHTLTS